MEMEIKFTGDDSDAPRRAIRSLTDYAVRVGYLLTGEHAGQRVEVNVYIRRVDVDSLYTEHWNTRTGAAEGEIVIPLEDILDIEVF